MRIRMQQNPGISAIKNKKKKRVVPLREMFEAYAMWNPISDVMEFYVLSFSQLTKWLTAAKIIDMSCVTTTDAFLCFFQFRKRAIEYDEFLIFLKDLAETKDLCIKTMKYKLQTCGKPSPPPDVDTDDSEEQ